MNAVSDPDNVVIKALARLTNSLPIGRDHQQKQVTPTDWKTHRGAVERLMFQLDNLPEGQTARLKKTTSNLLRGRSDTEAGELDVEELGGVIAIDPVRATADVQGMCTYGDLVDATLPFGLVPLVVPHLKTITIGGAVAGQGVESTSFRNGLPHASVLEMDILTGTGEIITCSPTRNADLYRGFPNSYGTLGYAVRLKIELEPVLDYVTLRHLRFDDLETLASTLMEVSDSGVFEGQNVDYLDGVVFSPTESYLILGTQTAEPGPVSDYTGEDIYYRSIQHASGVSEDRLTIRDYLWRWDSDLFWCSRDVGAQNPTLRKLWPHDLKNSNFYSRLMDLDRKFNIVERLDEHAGRPPQERVVQDVKITAEQLVEFLDWFLGICDISPLWLCPIRLREVTAGGVAVGAEVGQRPWSLHPLTRGRTWVNLGFWSSVPVDLLGSDAPEHAFNLAIEEKLTELGGHKSLYAEVFYTREEFEALYGGEVLSVLKKKYDPSGRFPGLYEKTVQGA